MDSDEPTAFSPHTKQLLTLYEELHSFKDDPNFHEVGFGRCCGFRDWQTRSEALQADGVRLTRFGDDWLLIRADARDVSRAVRKLRQIPAGEQSVRLPEVGP